METSPAIILVRPQMGENIGAVARAMMNFGLSDLRLVAPRDGWPNEAAYKIASGADAILDAARVFENCADALHDCRLAFGTSSRGREMVKPFTAPETMAARIVRESGVLRTAILFGAERTGLTNEETMLCDEMVCIPTHPAHASLNLAQSVVVVAYEWFKRSSGGVPDTTKTSSATASPLNPEGFSPPATKAEVQGFFDHLESALDEVDFWKTPQKKPRMWQNLRNLFLRAQPTEQEIRTLRGLVRELREGKKQG